MQVYAIPYSFNGGLLHLSRQPCETHFSPELELFPQKLAAVSLGVPVDRITKHGVPVTIPEGQIFLVYFELDERTDWLDVSRLSLAYKAGQLHPAVAAVSSFKMLTELMPRLQEAAHGE